MKIAFASKDGISVNQHFGWCETFFIYEVTKDDYTFLEQVDSSLQIDNEAEKLEYKINCLLDSDIVCVAQIGPKASSLVKSAGIFPLKSSSETEKIEDVISNLQKLIVNNPPLWLQRIILRAN